MVKGVTAMPYIDHSFKVSGTTRAPLNNLLRLGAFRRYGFQIKITKGTFGMIGGPGINAFLVIQMPTG